MKNLNSEWFEEFKPTNHMDYNGDVALSDAVISQFKVIFLNY